MEWTRLLHGNIGKHLLEIPESKDPYSREDSFVSTSMDFDPGIKRAYANSYHRRNGMFSLACGDQTQDLTVYIGFARCFQFAADMARHGFDIRLQSSTSVNTRWLIREGDNRFILI